MRSSPNLETISLSPLISLEGCVLVMLEIERKGFDDEIKRKEGGIGSEETRRRCSQGEGKRKQVKRVERIRGKGKGKMRKSGKGVGIEGFGWIERRSEDLDSLTAPFRDDDVVVLIDCHSISEFELTIT